MLVGGLIGNIVLIGISFTIYLIYYMQWSNLFKVLIFWTIIITLIAIGIYIFIQIGIPLIKGNRIGFRTKKKLERK